MNKSTTILIAAFIVLAITAYFFLKPSGGVESSYKEAAFSMTMDSASVMKIQIDRPGGKSVTIENQGGAIWMITSPVRYKANNINIFPILGGMGTFKVGSLVSSNPEKQSLYQLDSTGTKLTLTDKSGKQVSMIVGKTGPSYDEVYFRKDGSNDVYLGTGVSPFTINQDVREWRDKTVMATVKDSVKRIEYMIGSKNFVIQKDSTTWMLNGDTVATPTMNTLLTTVMDFKTEDFADTLTKPETEASHIKISSEKDYVLDFYPQPPDSAKYYVQTSESPQIFIVSKFSIQNLLGPIKDLLTPAKGGKAVKKGKPM